MAPTFSPWLPWFPAGTVIPFADLPPDSCFSVPPIMVHGRRASHAVAMPPNRKANRRRHTPKERKPDLTGAGT